MLITINELISFTSEENHVERVLWIDEGNFIAFVIDIYMGNALPKVRKISDILEGLDNGSIIKLQEDPYISYIDESKLEELSKNIRDKAWDIVGRIAGADNEPDIYKELHRGKLIKQVMEASGASKNMIYKYLRRYWQRGKVKNALLPDYKNSGGKGKERTPGAKKRGRPIKNNHILGCGVNVDEETKKIFRIAINRYYHTSKENSLKVAYEFMVKDFYTENYSLVSGIRQPILIDVSLVPSYAEFKYWYEKENDIKKKLASRRGDKKYQLNNRAITGKSDKNIIGPGSKYQIDATVADVYLVSRSNRDWIIGRPIVYVVIDVFSRIVTGLYVGLEGPSWLGAMMALTNSASNKVQYCKEYGIEIEASDWPCCHLPEAILADRGEMESKQVDNLVNSLHVRIENTPPYRADWKGIVEQYFKTLDTKVKPLLPGHIDTDFRERGEKDYRLDAKLDIYQFTQIIINCVLSHNKTHWLDNYVRDDDMIADGVKPIPVELWQWGILNRSGILRSFPEDIIKLNLMPSDKALVTAKGIKYKNMYYSCKKAVEELWFENARNKESWKVDISYDPRNMNFIYIRIENGRAFDICHLLDDRKYFDKTLEEIQYLDEYDKFAKLIYKEEQLQAKINLYSQIDYIVQEAEKMTVEQSKETSKTQKLKGIRDNRRFEKEKNRQSEAFTLNAGKDSTKENDNITLSLGEDSFDVEDLRGIEYLKRKQRERLNG